MPRLHGLPKIHKEGAPLRTSSTFWICSWSSWRTFLRASILSQSLPGGQLGKCWISWVDILMRTMSDLSTRQSKSFLPCLTHPCFLLQQPILRKTSKLATDPPLPSVHRGLHGKCTQQFIPKRHFWSWYINIFKSWPHRLERVMYFFDYLNSIQNSLFTTEMVTDINI